VPNAAENAESRAALHIYLPLVASLVVQNAYSDDRIGVRLMRVVRSQRSIICQNAYQASISVTLEHNGFDHIRAETGLDAVQGARAAGAGNMKMQRPILIANVYNL
jgi:hypothetical protein